MNLNSAVIEVVQNYISNNCNNESIPTVTEESKIIDDLGLDSLDLIELSFDLEAKIGKVISTDEVSAQDFKTISDLITFVKERKY
jgi:acyl carrier protein